MCQPEQLEGHQLGQFPVAAPDPGPLLPLLAGEDSLGAGAAAGPPDHSPADQQTGGALEGTACTFLGFILLNSEGFFFWKGGQDF